jgi:aspartate/tyrosine/aromatic aminotransferase
LRLRAKITKKVSVLCRFFIQNPKQNLRHPVITQLDKVAATTAIVTSTARVLSEANTVLGTTLSGSGALHVDASLLPKLTSKSE